MSKTNAMVSVFVAEAASLSDVRPNDECVTFDIGNATTVFVPYAIVEDFAARLRLVADQLAQAKAVPS